jgi:hypothetical protein
MVLRVIDVRVERCGAVHASEPTKWGACFAGGTAEELGPVISGQPPSQKLLVARQLQGCETVSLLCSCVLGLKVLKKSLLVLSSKIISSNPNLRHYGNVNIFQVLVLRRLWPVLRDLRARQYLP